MKKQKLLLITSFLFVASFLFSQGNRLNIDSIYKLIPGSPDSTKCKKLNFIARAIGQSYPDSAYHLADSARRIALRIGAKSSLAKSCFILGFTSNFKGKFDASIAFYEKALKIYEELRIKDDICNIYNCMGNTYMQLGNNAEAWKSYKTAYEMAKTEPVSRQYMAIIGVGISIMLERKDSLEEAAKYLHISSDHFKATGQIGYLAMTYTNLSDLYFKMKKLDEAEKYNSEGIKLLEMMNDHYSLATALGTRAQLLMKKGKSKEAIESAKRGYDLAADMKNLPDMGSKAALLSELFKELKDYKSALEYHELLMQHKDTLFNHDASKAFAEAETRFSTQEKERELKLKSLELEQSELKVSQKNHLLFVFIGASVIFIAFLFVLFRQNAQKKKANAQLVEQKSAIERQSAVIEEKNKDITDSINYSKHIQQAIIPSPQKIKQLLGESFVIFKPKDIVSGDFYLVEDHVGMIYVAAVDCTGHGVPGAMLSVFADSTIKNSIATNNFRNHPGALLSDLCFQFKSNLQSHHTDTNVNDGVDMSLVILDKKECKIYFAGARNGLVKVSNGELTEYHGGRWGISGTNKGPQMFFEDQLIDFKPGDWFYVYTDGFADQFGGPKGKKFKHKRMIEVMVENHKLPAAEQKRKLENYYDEWKGHLEQIDDVTLIGFKV